MMTANFDGKIGTRRDRNSGKLPLSAAGRKVGYPGSCAWIFNASIAYAFCRVIAFNTAVGVPLSACPYFADTTLSVSLSL